ncbi:MAG: EthD family reductase [Rhodococcus sp. (in: high G+C Gram-positive bacteria)]
MYRITIVYNQPHDSSAFDAHYRDTHLALVRAVPGVLKFAAGKCEAFGGQPPSAYLLAQMYFESADAAGAALSSTQGQAAADDLGNFADGGVTMLFSDESTVLP